MLILDLRSHKYGRLKNQRLQKKFFMGMFLEIQQECCNDD